MDYGWIDSHAHICSYEFDDDRDLVIKNIEDNNISKILIICCELSEIECAIKLKKKDSRYKIATGFYPGDISKYTDELYNKYYDYMISDDIDVIGEIGLDYHYEKDSKEAQIELFRRQVQLAKKLNKPISVHSRDAMKDTFDILKEYRVKGVLHSFSGSVEMAREFCKLGYYISLSGPVTFKNAVVAKEVAKSVDIDKLLIETDCPYMTPTPFRGQRNEPMYVKYTGEYIAGLRNIDVDALKKKLNENFGEFLFYK